MAQQITIDWKAMYEVLQECNADLEQRCRELDKTNISITAVYQKKVKELQAENAELRKRLELVNDETLADKIAIDCHDKDHDIRWCPTCEARDAGIDEYREALKAAMGLKEGE